MSMGKALFFAGYFGLIGYGIAKSGADKKMAQAVKKGYTGLVRYTKEVPAKPVPELLYHGEGCPGHTTGLPVAACLNKVKADDSS